MLLDPEPSSTYPNPDDNDQLNKRRRANQTETTNPEQHIGINLDLQSQHIIALHPQPERLTPSAEMPEASNTATFGDSESLIWMNHPEFAQVD